MTQYVETTLDGDAISLYEAAKPPVIAGSLLFAIDPPVRGWPPKPFPAAVRTYIAGVWGWRDPRSIEQVRADKLADINAERARRIAAFDRFPYEGTLYDGDDVSRERISNAARGARLAVPLPPGFTWRSFYNMDVKMTNAQLLGMEKAMVEAVNKHTYEAHRTASVLKARVVVAESAADVDAIPVC